MTQTIINVPAADAFDPTDIEITDGVDDAFLIKDTGGNEWFKIDTRSGTGENCINMAYTTGQRVLIGKPASAVEGPFAPLQVMNQNNDTYVVRIYGEASYSASGNNHFAWRNAGGKPVWIHPAGGTFDIRGSSGSFDFRNSSNLTMFTMDNDSNATFTLDDGSAATFTITDNASPTPALHLRCTESASTGPQVEVNGLKVFPGKRLSMTSATYGTNFLGSINQARSGISLGATSTTRNLNIGAVNMDNFAQILTATPSTTSQTFTLDFNNTNTSLDDLPIGLYKLVLKNAGTQSCTFTAASTMAGGGVVKGVDISGASIGVIDSTSGSITAAAGETIYVEVTNHVSDSAGGAANRFIICKTICKI